MLDQLRQSTQINRSCEYRKGNVVELPADGQVIVTGDLHGHRRNFERIVNYADLNNHPERHVILQEILHGGEEDGQGGDLSYRVFAEILAWQAEHPARVHLIMGNHDTAIINDGDVLKNGKEMNKAMQAAMRRDFGSEYGAVMEALREQLLSQPLAVRLPNRIWLSHSLPADRMLDQFDPDVFQRPLTMQDCQRPGSAYLLTWGRRQSQETVDAMAEMLDVDVFVLGHQTQETGWARAARNAVILISEHNHGCILPIDPAQSCTADELIERIVPLASLA